MAKYVCTVCGYVHEGDEAPEFCPVCKAPASKFQKVEGEMAWAAEHVVGVAKGAPEDIIADLRANFQGECSEVGMYLAMARVAHREGYPEIGLYWEKAVSWMEMCYPSRSQIRERESRILRKPWNLYLPRNRNWTAPAWGLLLWRLLWTTWR